MPAELDAKVVAAAKKAGMSVNEWLTRAAEKALGRIKP
jgi:predicted HicB family RNase H-like nuclease